MSHFILLSHLCYCWLVVCENEVINGVINEVIKYCFLHQAKNEKKSCKVLSFSVSAKRCLQYYCRQDGLEQTERQHYTSDLNSLKP